MTRSRRRAAFRGGAETPALFVLIVLALCLAPLPVRGDDGFLVAPYLRECDAAAGCTSASVPWTEIRARCRDLDGCTVRLSMVYPLALDPSVVTRIVGVPRALGVQEGGDVWFVNESFSSDATSVIDFPRGANRNSSQEVLVELDAGLLIGSCVFSDDTAARPTQLSFELTTTAVALVNCVVRIDD